MSREFKSGNGQFVFRVIPEPRRSPTTYGNCEGEMIRVEEGGIEEMIWCRHLINNQSPYEVFVSDSGEYVVTLDEWGSLGRLPVVIYGAKGNLIHVHNIESLQLNNDLEHISRTISSLNWAQDSISFFSEDSEYFCMHLHWGRTLIFHLKSGSLVDEQGNLSYKGFQVPDRNAQTVKVYASRRVNEIAIALLDSPDPAKRRTGVRAVGQLKLVAAETRLRELLLDNTNFRVGAKQDESRYYYIRAFAEEALKALGKDPGSVVTKESVSQGAPATSAPR